MFRSYHLFWSVQFDSVVGSKSLTLYGILVIRLLQKLNILQAQIIPTWWLKLLT